MFTIKYNENNLDNIYDHYTHEYWKNSNLVAHRLYVENNDLGFGERPFHALWNEILSNMDNISFLEIGVYKGQILSLIKLLSKIQNKECKILGVTPLDNTGDKYSNYQQSDYYKDIQSLFNQFNLKLQDDELCIGLSTDQNIKNKILNQKYNLIYIDGGHYYNCVTSDISLMKECLLSNGIVVFDDASSYKNFNKHLFLGHLEVAEAIKNSLENDDQFEEIMCVGHNRVFKRK